MTIFTSYDFEETIRGQGIERESIAQCVAAHGYSPEGGGSWSGGFLMEMKAGGFVYVSGWCDYTGWGCQDGTERWDFPEEPTLADLHQGYEAPKPEEWAEAPADLNRFIAGEIASMDDFAS